MSFKFTDLKDSSNQEWFNAAAASMGYGIYERQLIFGLKYNGKTHTNCGIEFFGNAKEGAYTKKTAKYVVIYENRGQQYYNKNLKIHIIHLLNFVVLRLLLPCLIMVEQSFLFAYMF